MFYSLEDNAKNVQHIEIVRKTIWFKKLSTDHKGLHLSLFPSLWQSHLCSHCVYYVRNGCSPMVVTDDLPLACALYFAVT